MAVVEAISSENIVDDKNVGSVEVTVVEARASTRALRSNKACCAFPREAVNSDNEAVVVAWAVKSELDVVEAKAFKSLSS